MLRSLLSYLGIYGLYRRWLRIQINKTEVPEHIGVILDGNRRWASERKILPWEGHKEGAEKVKTFLKWCLELGIKTVTLYGFSTENFNRPLKEVETLMRLYEENLLEISKSEIVHENKVRISAIGRINMLPENLRSLIEKIENSTKDYNDFFLNIALAYGGRAEIVDAAKKISLKVKENNLKISEINEDVFEEFLYTSYLPKQDPDLIIRTSGESRLSNFLIWQSAYSEIFLIDVYWPDFREIDLYRTVRSYQGRFRRFGK
jgi:tritrans,polycis-undecaprenyl-diphosphate synthase [geranylgeranyl-diphosphate specific]